jgi:hypothetical protein
MNFDHIDSIPDDDAFPLSAYRDRTIAMLRRYGRCAVELGRLPSLLGREFFRAKVTSYTVHTFEDAIIFAFDMERSLERLKPFERMLLGRVVLQEYSQGEVARMLRIDRTNVVHRYLDALDHLTEILLDSRLLSPTILERGRYHRPVLVPRPPQRVGCGPDRRGVSASSGSPGIDLKACQERINGSFAASA